MIKLSYDQTQTLGRRFLSEEGSWAYVYLTTRTATMISVVSAVLSAVFSEDGARDSDRG